MTYLIFFFNDTATTEIYTLSLHDALPISIHNLMTATNSPSGIRAPLKSQLIPATTGPGAQLVQPKRSEEHTSELQSRLHLVCRLLLEKKNNRNGIWITINKSSQYKGRYQL